MYLLFYTTQRDVSPGSSNINNVEIKLKVGPQKKKFEKCRFRQTSVEYKTSAPRPLDSFKPFSCMPTKRDSETEGQTEVGFQHDSTYKCTFMCELLQIQSPHFIRQISSVTSAATLPSV